MDKNGFARLKAFDARQTDDSTVVFTLQSDSSTFRQYPFDFLLSVKYRITGSALHVTLRVKNNSDTPMPAGLGLHPGFVWKRTGEPSRLVFSDPETVQAFRPDGKRYLLMDHENVLALTRDSFSQGAITMEHLKSRWVEFTGRIQPGKSEFTAPAFLILRSGVWLQTMRSLSALSRPPRRTPTETG